MWFPVMACLRRVSLKKGKLQLSNSPSLTKDEAFIGRNFADNLLEMLK
jgi:hypothetical protein